MTECKKVQLIAAMRQNIGTRWVSADEEFEADEQEAADLIAMRFAILNPSAPPPPPEPPRDEPRQRKAHALPTA